MTRITLVLLTMLLALTVAEAQNQPAAIAKSEAAEKALIAQERAVHEAVTKADKASFLSLVLIPEAVWTTSGGFVPMNLLADALEQFKVSKWDIMSPRVTWLGDDSAVVRYAWTGTGTFHDRPLASTSLASTVWTKRNGKWLAVHHQQTDLSQE